jgi:hypothetical protein
MTLEATQKLAKHIFRLLKVTEVVFPIGRTNKGNLGLKFSSNMDDFEIMLDAVPLSTKSILEDENNIELKRMLEKYWFEDEEGSEFTGYVKPQISHTPMKTIYPESTATTEAIEVGLAVNVVENKIVSEAAKKRGRPSGSKNKK